MPSPLSRREFLGTAGAIAAAAVAAAPAARPADAPSPAAPDLPLVDLHVHLDGSTLEKVLDLSREHGVKFGIVEHAGTKENKYPVVLSNDAELLGWIAKFEGKPAWKGVQAEWTDWMGCFSREAAAKLDYVITDAMTYPKDDGKRHKLWEPGFEIGDPEAFMDRFVDWHVRIIETEPIDLFVNSSWLPSPLGEAYERFWTEKRMERVIRAAVKAGVAIEISSSFQVPKMPFLRMAKAAGAKFCFGSNGRYPNMGKLDHSLRMARELGLTAADLFTPAPPGKRAVDRWKGAWPSNPKK
jgi:hypothetical protein